MTRSQRVQTIVKLNQHKERMAALKLADTQSSLYELKQRLRQMLSYREEYIQIFKVSEQCHSINTLRERQAFVLQLDQGIEILCEQVRIQEQMNEQERQSWIEQKQQLDTMQSIYKRCLSAEQQLQTLRSQQELDEIAINQSIRKQ